MDFDAYLRRGELLVELYRRYESLEPDDTVLELGTGWMHWYAIYLRMAFECRMLTVDVWDNRQLDALKSAFSRLLQSSLRDEICESETFEELYAKLGMTHHIIPSGRLNSFSDLTSVFSMHVMEHVPRTTIEAVIGDMYAAMKPGHHTIHQIGIDDHLAHYDSRESHKRYISFSEGTWCWFFENDVQYHNRLQPSDFVDLFEAAGFKLVHREQENTDISELRVSPQFSSYGPDDLRCTILTVVFRKP
jgi:cyclopropane fatty-acyl-phospholipid synthase-like methyltransferase